MLTVRNIIVLFLIALFLCCGILYIMMFSNKLCLHQASFFAASYPKAKQDVELHSDINKISKNESDLWSNIIERIHRLKDSCGDLCDTEKNIKEGEFLGTVESNINCKRLMKLLQDFGDNAPQMRPKNWTEIPPILQKFYNYNGRVSISHYFIDSAHFGGNMSVPENFTFEYMEEKYLDPYRKSGNPVGPWYYPGSGKLVDEAADYLNVTNKTVLVIGTQVPWLEAILLSKRPKKIVTVEYGYFISEYPTWVIMRPLEFRKRFFDGTLDTFDHIFTYSSLEHSGLGRYGDPLNPWGDIMAVAEAWCVAKPNAKLALGLPTSVSAGYDQIQFNAGRIYGPIMYSFLVTGLHIYFSATYLFLDHKLEICLAN